MSVNKWQRKRQAYKRRSINQHAAKARKRMRGPPVDYPPDRPFGRKYNIVINAPWMRGNNTRLHSIDFAPIGHRRDRIVFDGRIMSMSEFVRNEFQKIFPV